MAVWCAGILCGWVGPILNPHGPRSEAGRHRFDRNAAIRPKSCSKPRRGATPKPKPRRWWLGGKTAGRRGGIRVRHGVLGPCVFGVINAGNVESMELACRNATEEPSEANLVKLLDLWSAGWKRRGRTRAVGPGAYERYATLGLFRARGCGRRLERDGPVGSLHRREPLSADPLPGRHLDVHRRAFQSPHGSAPRHPEHARALESCAGSGEYTGGRVWIEDDEGGSTAWLEDKKGGRELRVEPHKAACGLLLLMFHKPMLGRRSSTGRH